MASELEILPKSRIVKVELEVRLPASATHEDVDEWVTFNMLGGSMSGDNPLRDFEVESIRPPVLTDTGFHLHEKVEPDGNGRHHIRRWREGSPFDGPSAIEQIMGGER